MNNYETLNQQLKEALNQVTAEKNRFAVAADLINSANWSFALDENDEVVDAKFFGEPIKVLGIDLQISPHAWEEILHPSDREEALKAFNATIKDHSGKTPYDVVYRMRDKEGNYNWFRSAGKVIEHPDGSREFFGIHLNINDSVEAQNRHVKENEAAKKLIESVASIYRFAFAVNMTTSDFRPIRLEDEVKRRLKITGFSSYEEAVSYLYPMLHPADVERIKRELDFNTIRQKLKEKVSYNVEYRVLTKGATNWHEFNVTLISGDEIAMGFGEKDLEITKRHLEDNRFSEYFALYEVDLYQETFKVVLDSPYYGLGKAGQSFPYSAAMKAFADSLEGEAREYFGQMADIERVKKILAGEGKHTYTYQSNNVDGRWIDCTCYVTFREEDGSPAMFTLGFTYIDSQGAARRELQNQVAAQKDALEEKQTLLQDALERANTEAQRNDLIIEAMKAGRWSYMVSAEDEVLSSYYSDDIYEMVKAKGTGKPMGWTSFIYPEDRERATNEFMAAIRDHTGKTKYDTTFRIMHPDGSVGWTRSAGRVVRHADGGGVFIGITMDISEQISTVDLAKQQRYIKAFGEMVNASLWSIDINEDGAIDKVFWSDEMRRMFGYEESEEAFPNQLESWSDLLHPEDKERAIQHLKDSIIKKNPDKFVYDIQYRILRKTGEYCWYHAVGRMENHEDGTRRIYGIISDISANKQLEEQLALTDGLSRDYHTVWLLDGFGKHNMHLYRSTGIKTIKSAVQLGLDENCYDTGIVKYVHDYVHEEDQERVLDQTRFETIERETPEVGTYVVTYRRYRPDHTSFDYHQMCFAKAVAENGTVNYLFAYRDADQMMRDQLAQQEALQQALDEAKSASKAKTEFLFNMSHDVRTPMNAIIGFTNMAQKHLDDPEKVADCLEKIKQSGGLLLSLINGVLDMSRIEHGSAEPEELEGDVLLSFASIESTLMEEARRKDVELTFEFGTVTDRYVYADYTRCLRIFTNLITNSIKYTKEGGWVKVHCEQVKPKEDGRAYFAYTIEDNGIGMSKSFQERMFEAFSRERNSTTSGIQGTGIGLSVCKSFVEYLGGTIECESELGVGTKFTVTLPFKVQKPGDGHNKDTSEVQSMVDAEVFGRGADFVGKKVLLVEDNELNREIAVDLLEDVGLVVEEAGDGAVAVKTLKEKGPDYYDVVLMDIQMPVMNGYEATKAIRKMYPDVHVPIVALSANAFEEDRKASIEAGMDDHIPKPINEIDLYRVLNKNM